MMHTFRMTRVITLNYYLRPFYNIYRKTSDVYIIIDNMLYVGVVISLTSKRYVIGVVLCIMGELIVTN